MNTSPGGRRLLRESAPVAAILLFWVVFARFANPIIAAGLHRAGVVMALLYTVVRGVTLARARSSAVRPTDLRGVLRENARVLIPAGAWFLAAQLVYVIEDLWRVSDLPGAFTSPADSIAFALTGAGVAVVLLYAVVVGSSRVDGDASVGGGDTADAAPADD